MHVADPDGNSEVEEVVGNVASGENGFLLLDIEETQIVLATSKGKHWSDEYDKGVPLFSWGQTRMLATGSLTVNYRIRKCKTSPAVLTHSGSSQLYR